MGSDRVPSDGDEARGQPNVGWWHYPHFFAALIFFPLIVLSTLDVGRLNFLVLGLLAASAAVYLYHQGKGAREIFFYAHLEETSFLQKFRLSLFFLLVLSLATGIVLVVSLLVFLLTVHWVVLAVVLPLQFLFIPLRSRLLVRTQKHLKRHSRMVLANFLTVLLLGSTTVLLLIGAKWVEMRFFIPEFTLLTADNMVSHVTSRIEYSLAWVQHLARTLNMFELQLLRAHGFAEGWVAHLILIYFLLPSTLAAFALPVIHGGISLLCLGRNNWPGEEGEDERGENPKNGTPGGSEEAK